jgi:hypothetical protein
MNFRLFRSSLLLLSFLLLSIGWVNANSIVEFSRESSKQIQPSHTNHQDTFCLPYELIEDNEVNESRKRFFSATQTILLALEIFFSSQLGDVYYYNHSSIDPPKVPVWLKNGVLLI